MTIGFSEATAGDTVQMRLDHQQCLACGRSMSRGKCKGVYACSDRCMVYVPALLQLRKDKLTHMEECAALTAGQRVGKLLDDLGKSDMAELTKDEWRLFCLTFSYELSLATLAETVRAYEPPWETEEDE